MGHNSDLEKQLHFIIELDKLKRVERRTVLMDGSRNENDAEHSWHLALMAIVLCDHAREKVDMLKVLKMVLIHDIVEIDAGDTFCYDTEGERHRFEKEQKAAKRIFGLLPSRLADDFKSLWCEFESRQTAEAKFAAALDRFHPLLHNYYTRGYAWQKHGVTSREVLERNKRIEEGAPSLWEYTQRLIHDAIGKKYLNP
jgi:putative hydrolase of HD superfamily